jgi:predicted HD phosphohydrolase
MSTSTAARTVAFTEMKSGSREDYELLLELEKPFVQGTASRVLRALEEQGNETLDGYQVSRLTHGLQTATRAWRDGADIDWVAGALLHDIGDGLAPQNHDAMAAEIVRPFLREEVVWCGAHHGIFQMVYYAHHYGWDKDARDRFRGQPHFGSCAEFCERWDQASFDPHYATLPLSFFAPLVSQVFARPAHSAQVILPGVRRPLTDAAVAAERLRQAIKAKKHGGLV